MNERKKVEERLRRKEAEIRAFEEQIRDAKVYMQALQDVLKLLPKDAEEQSNAEAVLRSGSAVARAREVILRRKEPTHLNVLVQELGLELTREAKASLSGSLAAYVRKGEIFTRPAPNTFGLVELGHKDEAASSPPDDFGAIETEESEETPF
jgi:hypothetical protein